MIRVRHRVRESSSSSEQGPTALCEGPRLSPGPPAPRVSRRSRRALSRCPLLNPGSIQMCPLSLARLYFFIRASGGCQSPGGCQSTLILIRTRALSGVNGSQQLSPGLSQPRRNSYITQCTRTGDTHTHTGKTRTGNQRTPRRRGTRTHTNTQSSTSARLDRDARANT